MTGRFAPTPSGELHLGNALSALLCWLSVRSQKGTLVMRVENLDVERTAGCLTEGILSDLRWLGLDWDDGPYFQSERTPFYEQCLQKRIDQGLIYPCFCGRAELHASRAPHDSDGTYVYSGKCRGLSAEEVAEKMRERPGALRVRVPAETVALVDGCQGAFSQNLAAECGDFIVRRSDGVFAYQLAASSDDGAMGVTEVVRGRDLLSSAPRQMWLLRCLGYEAPR
jgi:glutamyl-tRNA synthetase